MELTKYVACICEGTAERTTISMLLDADKLIFPRNHLLEGELLRCRSPKDFERQYLRKGFTEKVTVLRIHDSRREQFNLSAAYAAKANVINIITAPEIEMLVILKEGKYDEYKKAYNNTKIKPNEFCKSYFGYGNVKSEAFWQNYFSDSDELIAAIMEYKRVSNIPSGEFSLADLLK